MSERFILLTLKEKYANQIFAQSNSKRTEYRKRPLRLGGPTRTIIYVSKVGEIIDEFIMEPVSSEWTDDVYPLPIKQLIRYN